MKKKLNLRDFAILQLVVLIYTSSTVISKIAAQSAESGKGWTFLLLYGAEIGVLGIYALCWQQVIKHLPLTTAYANKAVTVVWGILLGLAVFGEAVTLRQVIGAAIIICGIVLFVRADNENREGEDSQ